MIRTIDEFRNAGVFNDIDIHLADFLTGKAAKSEPFLYLLILLLSTGLPGGCVSRYFRN
jgi:hypothetical protein